MGVLETYGGFGNLWGFWKPTEVLETYGGFGNLWRFWKPMGVLETYGGFGNLPGFWKPTGVLETYRGFGNLWLGNPWRDGYLFLYSFGYRLSHINKNKCKI